MISTKSNITIESQCNDSANKLDKMLRLNYYCNISVEKHNGFISQKRQKSILGSPD